MRYFYFSLFFCLLFSFRANAQTNFKPGYILKTNKDTVKGFIDYREWVRNPKEVVFKQDLNKPIQKITVANASGFGINGADYYDKAIVKVNNSPVQLSRVGSSIDTTYTIDTVFLQTVVKGKNLSLYEFSNEVKSHFYILNEKTNEITALNKYLYINEQRTFISVNSYINQLMVFAAGFQPGNEKLQAMISRADYSEKDLSHVVLKLNGDSGIQKTIKSNFGTRFFVGAAIKSSKVSFIGSNAPFVGRSTSSVAPEISGGVDIVPNKNTEKMVIRMELTLSRNHFTITDPQSDAVALHSLDFKQVTISLTPQIMYNIYSTDNLKLFVDAGVSLNSNYYNKYYYVSKFNNGSENKVEKFPLFEKFNISIPVKAGVQLNKRFQFFAGYTFPTAIDRYLVSETRQSSVKAGVTYLFK
ncbi:outer membrane beta-barrel protein [Mucilaginibacter sp.]|uniref:outer membrane beta-barrel protein n=1 Tax=Mucilaginibacter sp. TaxID=1882438 RepID=UPI002631D30B|nr:outer membrane beta-barrel protein [Mucilaginibacter sp.]MDB5127708.1 hypothetical protein [Mucilaginibacter sp.]